MNNHWYIGIDIGSTAAKAVAIGPDTTLRIVVPAGWSSLETAALLKEELQKRGVPAEGCPVVATGYGRNAVSYADKKVTEITCHAAGCASLHPTCTVIDVGGQDTKAIHIQDGTVDDFIMNDKCSAGTGKFIEIMANRLGCTIDSLFALAQEGTPIAISSLCTVFAESEITGYIGQGTARPDIAAGIVSSVAEKVASLACQIPIDEPVLLTGGLSHIAYFTTVLQQKLQHTVQSFPNGRYAGAYGAALLAKNLVPAGRKDLNR